MSDRPGTDVFDKYHEYGVDLKRRRVFMQTPFWPVWAGKRKRTKLKGAQDYESPIGWSDMVVRNLLWLDQSPGTIELWLNTPGGSMQEMWAIYDVMQTANNSVITVAMGEVCSAGCLILAGATATRYTMPKAFFMWHGGFEGADLTPGEFDDRAAFYKLERKIWVETMATHTTPREDDGTGRKIRSMKGKIDFWEERTHDRELWFSAAKMIENGIVDEIWSKA